MEDEVEDSPAAEESESEEIKVSTNYIRHSRYLIGKACITSNSIELTEEDITAMKNVIERTKLKMKEYHFAVIEKLLDDVKSNRNVQKPYLYVTDENLAKQLKLDKIDDLNPRSTFDKAIYVFIAQAILLADIARRHTDEIISFIHNYDEGSKAENKPWYEHYARVIIYYDYVSHKGLSYVYHPDPNFDKFEEGEEEKKSDTMDVTVSSVDSLNGELTEEKAGAIDSLQSSDETSERTQESSCTMGVLQSLLNVSESDTSLSTEEKTGAIDSLQSSGNIFKGDSSSSIKDSNSLVQVLRQRKKYDIAVETKSYKITFGSLQDLSDISSDVDFFVMHHLLSIYACHYGCVCYGERTHQTSVIAPPGTVIKKNKISEIRGVTESTLNIFIPHFREDTRRWVLIYVDMLRHGVYYIDHCGYEVSSRSRKSYSDSISEKLLDEVVIFLRKCTQETKTWTCYSVFGSRTKHKLNVANMLPNICSGVAICSDIKLLLTNHPPKEVSTILDTSDDNYIKKFCLEMCTDILAAAQGNVSHSHIDHERKPLKKRFGTA